MFTVPTMKQCWKSDESFGYCRARFLLKIVFMLFEEFNYLSNASIFLFHSSFRDEETITHVLIIKCSFQTSTNRSPTQLLKYSTEILNG